MDNTDFYNDRKYCQDCQEYVPYLQSMEHSYCTLCGAQVRLFSEEDWETFHAAVNEKKPKGGRPRKPSLSKGEGKETA